MMLFTIFVVISALVGFSYQETAPEAEGKKIIDELFVDTNEEKKGELDKLFNDTLYYHFNGKNLFSKAELKENADGIIFIEKDGKKLSKFLIELSSFELGGKGGLVVEWGRYGYRTDEGEVLETGRGWVITNGDGKIIFEVVLRDETCN